jgi:hypothetical protein
MFPDASFPALPGSETMLRYRVNAKFQEKLHGESMGNL